ncbi:tetratricopeptide repeat-containing diguanylate cyclase [Solibacillus sp. FSL H8-0538]|uniref:tetratricopeptide repeat-containing diguanylate cyclase n=1 Tax=Solibacillus sp. FSL H8-0538 TaxID=2921400 RepID=UPI0030F6F99C
MNIHIPHFTQLEPLLDRYFTENSYSEVINGGKQLLEESKLQGNMQNTMVAHLYLAYAHFCLGEIESAFEHALQYKDLCEEFGETREKYYLYYINAYIYEFEENYHKAKESLERCMEIAQEHEDYLDLCISYNFYNHILLLAGEFELAAKNGAHAKQLANLHCPNEFTIHCQNDTILAAALIELGYYTKASPLLQALAENPIILHNQRERSRYNYVQAMYNLRTGELQGAIHYFKEAEKISHELNDYHMQKQIALQLADIYEVLEDYRAALCRMKEYIRIKEAMHAIRLASKIAELDLKHSVAVIEHRANIDPLSGVYNRYYLEKKTNTWLEQSKDTNDHLCCIVFDVDNFKHINDNYGHLFGDEVIKMIGRICNAVLNKKDTLIARYGGDEFVVILKNYPQQHIMSTARALFEEITAEQVKLDDYSLNITISMGLVCNDSVPSKRFTQLFRVADQALYMAKNQGKNQIVSLSNMSHSL